LGEGQPVPQGKWGPMNSNGACAVPTATQLTTFRLLHNGMLLLPVTATWSIQSVTGGTDQTLGESSSGQTIPI